MGIDPCGVSSCHKSVLLHRIGTKKLIACEYCNASGVRVCTAQIDRRYLAITVDITQQVNLDILDNVIDADDYGILAGNVICLADFQGICTEFYIGKTVIYRVSLYNHFISRLGSSFRNEL